MDVGLAGRRIVELARWWTSASPQARIQLLTTAAKENRPPLRELQLAAYLSEAEAGTVEEG